MNRFSMIVSIVLLVSSLVLIFVMLFSPQPINITLETGQEVTTSTPDYYSLSEVLLLVVASFLIGGTSLYLFYNAGNNVIARMKEESRYDVVHPLLKHDEKKVFSELKHGSVLQNDLVAKTGMSKVAVTRALAKLESKGLVVKERHGLTNKVRLK